MWGAGRVLDTEGLRGKRLRGAGRCRQDLAQEEEARGVFSAHHRSHPAASSPPFCAAAGSRCPQQGSRSQPQSPSRPSRSRSSARCRSPLHLGTGGGQLRAASLPWTPACPAAPGPRPWPPRSGSARSPSSMRDSTDRARLRMLSESVDWDRIRRSPSGDSSLKCLGREAAHHPDAGRTARPGAGPGRGARHRLLPSTCP